MLTRVESRHLVDESFTAEIRPALLEGISETISIVIGSGQKSQTPNSAFVEDVGSMFKTPSKSSITKNGAEIEQAFRVCFF